eukprot:COSAG01_NODE_1789_length_9228_cov_4.869989_1_plen_124_part_10
MPYPHAAPHHHNHGRRHCPGELLSRDVRASCSPALLSRPTNLPACCSGFGFITFEDPKDAQEAHDALSGHTVDGRALRLDYDAGKDKKTEGGFLGGGGSGGGEGGADRAASPARGRSRSRSRSR